MENLPAAAMGMNSRIVKEPLGFMRILQIIMAILAFATTAGYWTSDMRIPYSCELGKQSESAPIEWGYPFDLTEVRAPANFCPPADGTKKVILFTYGAVSQSQFFVCTGVLSFLYALGILAVYLLAWGNYQNDPRYAMVDFLVTAILALFWFIGSCAWASGLSMVKSVTDPRSIGAQLRNRHGSFPCTTAGLVDGASPTMCNPTQTWNYAALNISLIAGFACIGLWTANLWFVYKETAWYKNRAALKGVSGPQQAGGGPPHIPAGDQQQFHY